MKTTIRKWGNSAGVIIPARALDKAGMCLGDSVEVQAEDAKIILKSPLPRYSLAELLLASPPGAFALDEEDKQWLQNSRKGREIE
jgi:antitoxin ChpS